MRGVPDGVLDAAARRFALLADPTRLRVVRSLLDHGETSVSDLARLSGTTVTNVSQHLARLQADGLVRGRRVGRTVRYAVADPSLEAICDAVCRSVAERAVG
ncbi:MAG: ArsR/SmtB family transcription factor [Actinomycetota bacterium]